MDGAVGAEGGGGRAGSARRWFSAFSLARFRGRREREPERPAHLHKCRLVIKLEN